MKKIRLTIHRPTFVTTLKVAVLVGLTWALFMTILGTLIAITNPRGFFPGSTKLEAVTSMLSIWVAAPLILIIVGAIPAYLAFWFLQIFIKVKLEFYMPADSDAEIVEYAVTKTDRGVV